MQTAVCKSCHDRFDPIGFGFEHFDEAGRYRDTENGYALDATGTVPLTGDGFDGQEELARALAASEEVGVCVSGQMVNYAFGGGGGVECLGEGARTKLLAEGSSLIDFLASLAGEPHFTRRLVR